MSAKVWPKKEETTDAKRRPRYGDLAPKYPVLWSLLAPAGAENMSASAIGNVMESRLRGSISRIQEGLILPRSKQVVEVEAAQRVLELLLLDDESAKTDDRRYKAIDEVGGGWDIGGWKRAHGPEWAFCHLLAKHLVAQYSSEALSGDEGEAA